MARNRTIHRRQNPRSQRSHDKDDRQSARSAGAISILMSRRLAFVALIFILTFVWLFWRDGQQNPTAWSSSASDLDWDTRRNAVRDAFVDSWDAYSKYAWGSDQFHPISQTGSQMSPRGLGWIIIDSLDTLMIMNLTEQLGDSRRWISRSLDYNQEQDVNTFETTIRMLGGLLSAHFLSTVLPSVSSRRDHIYLENAIKLADRLLGAYDSPSGIPYASVMLSTGAGIRSHADGGSSSTAEATTLQLEMKYLSNLTANGVYWRKAEKVMEVIDRNKARDGLVPIFIEPHSGRYTTREIRLGSRGDSYYEYLVKQYHQTAGQEPIYNDMWQEALAGIEKHLLIPTKDARLQIIAELPDGIGGRLSPKMDHLVCFLPGAIALGATNGRTEAEVQRSEDWNLRKKHEMDIARELMKTCWGMYAVTETGLAPEIVWFSVAEKDLRPDHERPMPSPHRDSIGAWKQDFQIKSLDAHNLQRPETVESLFVMWRITGDVRYREWGWKIFEAFQRHSQIPIGQGYTSLNNVNQLPPPKRDNMESFWLAETLKYLYLLFAPADILPLTEVVFNTEAHPLPVMRQDRFKTGWKRHEGPNGFT